MWHFLNNNNNNKKEEVRCDQHWISSLAHKLSQPHATIQFWVTSRTHKMAQFCATTRHMVSYECYRYNGESCVNTHLPLITRHAQNYAILFALTLLPNFISIFITIFSFFNFRRTIFSWQTIFLEKLSLVDKLWFVIYDFCIWKHYFFFPSFTTMPVDNCKNRCEIHHDLRIFGYCTRCKSQVTLLVGIMSYKYLGKIPKKKKI